MTLGPSLPLLKFGIDYSTSLPLIVAAITVVEGMDAAVTGVDAMLNSTSLLPQTKLPSQSTPTRPTPKQTEEEDDDDMNDNDRSTVIHTRLGRGDFMVTCR